MKFPLIQTLRWAGAGALAVSASTITSPAEACGGLFCNSSNPVNQTAERIIFAQDDDGNVTQIVEILYEGDAEKFAWVLPVPGTPDVGVSSRVAFDRLQGVTNPTYQLIDSTEGICNGRFVGGASNDSASGDGDGVETGGGVTVVDEGSVGPYEFETIAVDPSLDDPAQVAVDWLTLNEYDLGATGPDVLRPYLANGLNLIAFRLQKGKSSGAIRPVTLKYKANALAIPIRPTAVAANDDMGVMVWILGESRAVPTNYLGLELNELLIDWMNPNNTYNQVVIAAANEAGGQGFVTEMAEPAAQFAENVISFEWESANLEELGIGLETQITSLTWNFGGHDGFLDLVSDHLPLRQDVTPADFIACPDCYFYGDDGTHVDESDPIYQADVTAFAQAVEDDVLAPIRETAELFGQFEYMTRLYTTMSAEEMTKDPVFDFNPDLKDVSNQHVADRVLTCDGPQGVWKATMPDGTLVYGEGFVWPHALDNTELPMNVRTVSFSTSGQPQVVDDNTATIQSIHDTSEAGQVPVQFREGRLGGCAVLAAPTPTSLWFVGAPLMLMGLLVARRRQPLIVGRKG